MVVFGFGVVLRPGWFLVLAQFSFWVVFVFFCGLIVLVGLGSLVFACWMVLACYFGAGFWLSRLVCVCVYGGLLGGVGFCGLVGCCWAVLSRCLAGVVF